MDLGWVRVSLLGRGLGASRVDAHPPRDPVGLTIFRRYDMTHADRPAVGPFPTERNHVVGLVALRHDAPPDRVPRSAGDEAPAGEDSRESGLARRHGGGPGPPYHRT